MTTLKMLFVTVVLACAPLLAHGASPASRVIVIHAGMLLANPGSQPLSRQTIVIRDGKIESVQEGFVDAQTIAPDARLIDLSTQFVLPALTDMHVHLSHDNNAKGAGAGKSKTLTVIEAEQAAQRILLAGFTTVRDLGGPEDIVFPLRDAIAGGLIPGPRIFAAGPIISRTGGHGGGGCDGVESCRRITREHITAGADVIKIATGGGASDSTSCATCSADMFPDEIDAVVGTARQFGMGVAAHAHSTGAINAALRGGVRTVEHGTHFDAVSVKLFKETGAILVPTTYVIDTIHNSPTILGSKTPAELTALSAALEDQRTVSGRAYRAGIKMALGTDTGNELTANRARELLYYVENGVPAAEAIKSATVNAAEALGWGDRLGKIKEGFTADIIASDGNPLADVTRLYPDHITFVMRDGKVYRLTGAR